MNGVEMLMVYKLVDLVLLLTAHNKEVKEAMLHLLECDDEQSSVKRCHSLMGNVGI